jgi:hypothetical protein
LRQIDIGDAAFGLQRGKQPAIDIVERCHRRLPAGSQAGNC